MTRLVELRNYLSTPVMTLLARDSDVASEAPLRNFDGVQPPGSNVQSAFGSGIYRVGMIERDLAMCSISAYASAFHAKAGLEAALIQTRSVTIEGWSLPIAAATGVMEWQPILAGIRVRLQLLPASAHWRYLTGSDSMFASQAGKVITGEDFVEADIGRVLVWAGGAEALITSVASATTAGSDIDQVVANGIAIMYDAATGLL